MGEKKKAAYLAVVIIHSIYAGMFLLSKIAFDIGMNTFVFVFYRQAAAALFLVPIAMLFEWKTAPPFSFSIFIKIFLLSLCGITMSLNIYGVALKYTSATLAAATTNSLPVITFFLALILGMEKVNIRRMSGVLKLVGVSLCMAGVAMIAFVKGSNLKLLLHHHLFSYHMKHRDTDHNQSNSNTRWIKGVFLMLLSNTFWGCWLVLQGKILKVYPSKLLSTTVQCLCSAIQSFVVAIAIERNPHQWKLGWDIKLLSVAYCGIVVTGVTFYLQAWVVENKGPVFLAMTTPMALLFTILLSALFFGDIICFGSLLGAILLVGGLYFVLWGKNKEQKLEEMKLDSCASKTESNGHLQKVCPRSDHIP